MGEIWGDNCERHLIKYVKKDLEEKKRKYKLGSEWLNCSPSEKDLGLIVDHTLQQCSLLAKKKKKPTGYRHVTSKSRDKVLVGVGDEGGGSSSRSNGVVWGRGRKQHKNSCCHRWHLGVLVMLFLPCTPLLPRSQRYPVTSLGRGAHWRELVENKMFKFIT